MSRPVRFCSRMCELQPASRAHVNIDVNICDGTSAKSSTMAAQNSTFVSSTRSGRRSRSSERAASSRARVLGAVDAVPEAHEPLVAVEDALHVGIGVAGALDLLDHAQDPCRGTAVQRTAHRTHRARDGGRDVGPGRGDHAGGEGAGIHSMLGSGDEVGVDGLHMARVGLVAPAAHEALDDGGRLVDVRLGDHRPADAARRLCDEGQGHDRHVGEVLASGVVIDVEERLQPPRGSQHRDRRLHVDAHVAGVDRDGERLGRGESGVELVVDEQAPHVAEGHAADELLDVDSAVAQDAAVAVRLGDLGLEGDHALQARHEIAHRQLPSRRTSCGSFNNLAGFVV